MNIAQIIGGIASSFYSNVMAYTILHVIWFRSVVNMGDWDCLVIVHSVVLLPAIANACIYVVAYQYNSQRLYNTANLDVYYVLRLISIFVNFIIYFATLLSTSAITRRFSYSTPQQGAPFSMVLRNLVVGRQAPAGSGCTSGEDSGRSKNTGLVDDAIATLVSRLKYYPLIQALARSGLSIYEYLYDWNFVVEGPIGRTQFALQLYSALVAPSASIGYLIIFLVLQPRAFFYLKGWFRGKFYLDGIPDSGVESTKTVLTKKSSKRSEYYGGDNDDQRISYESDSGRGSSHSAINSGRLLNTDFRSSDASDDRPLTQTHLDERSDDELLRIIVTYDTSRPKSGAESWRASASRASAALAGLVSRLSEKSGADDVI